VFTNADNFKVEFKDADIRTKALFLATVFYIVSVLLMYFFKEFSKVSFLTRYFIVNNL